MPASGRMAELLGALSLATDLGGGFPLETALRTAVIAARIASAAGLSSSQVRDAYYAGLLRYLGCTAYAHEEAQLAGGDDLAFLQLYADVELAKPTHMLRRTIAGLAKGANVAKRLRSIGRFVADPGAGVKVSTAHCELAVALAHRIGLSESVLRALAQIYERWDGRGAPSGSEGEANTPVARVTQLSQVVEVFARMHGRDAAVAETRRRRGTHFDPRLVDAFVADPAAVLSDLTLPSIWDRFLEAEPRPFLPVPPLRAVAAAFADYADLKSPYTLGHSPRVAALCVAAAPNDDERESLELAALLHDIGRVAVPNGIWDKPGPLNAAEWERVRAHAYHTERVLAQCPALAPLADLAAGDHERCDGHGYPRRISGAALTPAMRLLAAADVFAALQEERAHRPAHSTEGAARILVELCRDGTLDRSACESVLATVGHAPSRSRGDWPEGLTDREVEVLRLVARGLTNKEIGVRLSISARTVQTHLARVFEKTGVNTRAAAALFAATHDLAR
jgi:HD-GYP domain-containing protein (c-di-GMP phosphodiesterase class II)